MVRSRLGLKALGLCALVLGLMALSAGAAQAEEPGGSWTYLKAAGKELATLPNEQTIGGTLEGVSGTMLTKIGGNEVEYTCTSFTMNEGKLITGGTAKGSLTFHGCITKINKVTQPKCEPNAEGIHPGLITTLKMKATLLLHKLGNGTKDKIMIVEPDTGSNAFAHLELGELCSLGENVLFGGKFATIDCKGEGEKHLKEHLLTEFAALTHIWAISDTAEHAAKIDGTAFMFLTGANANKEWAALWN